MPVWFSLFFLLLFLIFILFIHTPTFRILHPISSSLRNLFTFTICHQEPQVECNTFSLFYLHVCIVYFNFILICLSIYKLLYKLWNDWGWCAREIRRKEGKSDQMQTLYIFTRGMSSINTQISFRTNTFHHYHHRHHHRQQDPQCTCTSRKQCIVACLVNMSTTNQRGKYKWLKVSVRAFVINRLRENAHKTQTVVFSRLLSFDLDRLVEWSTLY